MAQRGDNDFRRDESSQQHSKDTVEYWSKYSIGSGHPLILNASSSYDASLTLQNHRDWTVQDGYSRRRNESQSRNYHAYGGRGRLYSDLDELQLACERMGLPLPSIPEAASAVMNAGDFTYKATEKPVARKRRVSAVYDAVGEDVDDEEDDEPVSGSRRGSKKGPVKRKNKRRFAWPDDLHRDFVTAIFDTGLKHASTAQILEGMSAKAMKTTKLSADTVKYHLQRYKHKREEAKSNFMSSFEAGKAKEKLLQEGIPSSIVSGIEVKPPKVPVNQQMDHGFLSLPSLTKEEANSHLGNSLGYLIGLLVTLEQQVVAQRAAERLNSISKVSSLGAALSEMHEVRQKLHQHDNTDSTVLSTNIDEEAPVENEIDVGQANLEEHMIIEPMEHPVDDEGDEPLRDDDDVSNIGDEMDDERMFRFMKAL